MSGRNNKFTLPQNWDLPTIDQLKLLSRIVRTQRTFKPDISPKLTDLSKRCGMTRDQLTVFVGCCGGNDEAIEFLKSNPMYHAAEEKDFLDAIIHKTFEQLYGFLQERLNMTIIGQIHKLGAFLVDMLRVQSLMHNGDGSLTASSVSLQNPQANLTPATAKILGLDMKKIKANKAM